MASNNKKRILVLSSAEDEESTGLNNKFIGELNERIGGAIDLKWCNYHNLKIKIETGNIEVALIDSGENLDEFDFVYIKSFFRNSELAGVVVSYLESKNINYVCSELKNHIALTKLTQLTRLSLAKLNIPKTLFMLNDSFERNFGLVKDVMGLPFIFKAIDGSGGDENYLVKSEDDFQRALSRHSDLKFIAQEFINNDSDYRVLIVDGEVGLVIKRMRADNSTHLNNTSQGADATLLSLEDISQENIEMSLEAAKIMGREIAGVDLLLELGTGKAYILEVNASPQIASGAYQEEKLQLYANYFKKVVEDGRH